MTFRILIMILFYAGLVMGQGQDDNGRINFPGTPKEVIEADGISVPVFDFQGLEPLFSMTDGDLYVINFWATWCKPCVEEIPAFLRIADELTGSGVKFIFVSLDFRKNIHTSVIPFVKQKGLSGRVILLHDPDGNSWIERVEPSWTGSIPATLFYRNGQRLFQEKTLSYDELKTIIKSFNII